MRKRALVLCGGGAKGAYQVGVNRALQEMKLDFDIIVGTSIGAINGAMIAQNDHKVMYDLWHELDLSQVMNDGIDFTFSIESFMDQRNQLAKFLKKYADMHGADTTPLRDMLRRVANPAKIRERGITFGCVTVQYPSLEPVMITLDEMTDEQFPEYLIASSSCWPAFPIHTIDGKQYIDGGYYDNLPIQFAYQLGAQDLVVVDLNYPKAVHPEYEHQPHILYIRPSVDTGGFLHFDPQHVRYLIEIGYLDALRAFGTCKGRQYTFLPNISKESIDALLLPFIDRIHQTDVVLSKERKRLFLPKAVSSVQETVNQFIPYPGDEETYVIRWVEACASIMDIPTNAIRNFDELTEYIRHQYNRENTAPVSNLFQELFSITDPTTIKQRIAKLDQPRVLGYIVQYFISNPFSAQIWTLAPLFPDLICCGFFLFSCLDDPR